MFSNFDKLLDISKSYEPSTGSKCDSFGSNVYAPTADGLNDFNKGVAFMSSFGDHSVSINESIDQGNKQPKYNFDTKLLQDNLAPIEDYIKKTLKDLNVSEMERNKNRKDVDYGSSMGFMQGVNGTPSEDEQEAINLMKYNENESKYPSSLSTDIPFNSPDVFLKTIAQIYNRTNPDIAMELVKNASAFVNKFGVTTFRDYVKKVNDEIKQRNYSSDTRDDDSFN